MAAISTSQTGEVVQLQLARTAALAKIEEARNRRAKRLKEAKDEAKIEVDAYKANQDAHYTSLESQVNSQYTNFEESSRQLTVDQLERIKKAYEANKEVALELLLTQVLDIKPLIHVNYTSKL